MDKANGPTYVNMMIDANILSVDTVYDTGFSEPDLFEYDGKLVCYKFISTGKYGYKVLEIA